MKVQARRGGCVKQGLEPAGHKKTDIWRRRHAHRQRGQGGRQAGRQIGCRSDFNPTMNGNSPNRVWRQELWLKAMKAILLNPPVRAFISARGATRLQSFLVFD